MHLLRGGGRAILEENYAEVVANGVHRRSEYAKIRGDPPYRTEGYSTFPELAVKICAKEGRKSGLGHPKILFSPYKLIYDLSPCCACEGVGVHATFENEIIRLKGIG